MTSVLLVVPTQVISHSFVFIRSILCIYEIYTIPNNSPFSHTLLAKTTTQPNKKDLLFHFDLYIHIVDITD